MRKEGGFAEKKATLVAGLRHLMVACHLMGGMKAIAERWIWGVRQGWLS